MPGKQQQENSSDSNKFLEEGNPQRGLVEDWYQGYRRYALSIAYRMLGTVEDAEDVVQDCFAELQQKPGTDILNPKSYVAKMTVNRCLNLLNTARRQRETYIGEWLPEPLPGSGPGAGSGSRPVSPGYAGAAAASLHHSALSDGSSPEGPEDAAEQKDMISYAFLVLLERLNPLERAIFILREAFRYSYKEIAEMLGKTESNCRQIYSRARKSLSAGGFHPEDQYALPPGEDLDRRHLLERFTEAFLAHDTETLLALLAEQPVFISDGGGSVHTVLRPMKGRKGVLALLSSPRIFRALREAEVFFLPINGELHLVFRERERDQDPDRDPHQDQHQDRHLDNGQVSAVLCLALSQDQKQIQNLYLIVNPQKLKRISHFLVDGGPRDQ
ncbi:sigma-70 family RNA polymerase sigma factor [Paenibacillus physcomitrellae]|uniref:DNA-directed RNA polymerase sigma-70 factor n=1 Tax=Paenibacillus physcomitrellae TaxID=1619311 RepID=A0ABQ1FZN9_9BACL|nr:sigma-70 family RNA polymerase sigma factor [Paenibacillus physcomitrellae]GGA33826.1 DNA-directed RNA polymerase sigma-70 factor [Paenibacillus physcomitrellae]